MEDSRKEGRTRKKGLPPPDPHVDRGNGKKTIVYNTKKEEKKRDTEEKQTEKEREKERENRKG